MKLSAAFGDTKELRTKSFELGNHKFKVRVPLTKELEDMTARCETVDEAKFATRYSKATAGFKEGDGVEIKEDDVIVDGRSTKELVRSAIKMENRIVEFIKLLVPEQGSLEDITYEDIEAEWPFAVQLEMLEKISEAIQPGYKDSRKN